MSNFILQSCQLQTRMVIPELSDDSFYSVLSEWNDQPLGLSFIFVAFANIIVN